MIFLITAIKSINPTAEVSITNEDIDNIQWMNGTPVISKSDILAKQTELQTEYDALDYARNRAKEYPSIQDQLDMQYWDGINSTTTWADAIAKVKTENPKS
jgi:hypothetical protein|tara:strand:- start:49 stop:351 length:303 start_codon:yes stop_codon:yes gene_type:complete